MHTTYEVIQRYRWQYSSIYPSVDSFLISVRIMNEGEDCIRIY